MASEPKTYRDIRPGRNALKIVLIVIISIVLLCIFLFFYLQRFIVYTENGVRLEIPGLEFVHQDAADKSAEDSSIITSDQVIIDEPAHKETEPLKTLHGVTLSTESMYNEESHSNFIAEMKNVGADAVMIDLRLDDGSLTYDSAVSVEGMDNTVQLQGNIEQLISNLKNNGFYVVARISAFAEEYDDTKQDSLLLKDSSDELWKDEAGHVWLNPRDEVVKNYIVGLVREAADSGADEVLLTNVYLPPEAFESVSGISQSEYENLIVSYTESLKECSACISVYCDVTENTEPAQSITQIFSRVYFASASNKDADIPELFKAEGASEQYAATVPVLESAEAVDENAYYGWFLN